MQPKGPLMKEHRLIERMIGCIEKETGRIRQTGGIDPCFIYTAADFIRTYADKTHHGKEEDILFRDLNKKQMSADDKQVMSELIAEHVFGRKTTALLVEATKQYVDGERTAVDAVLKNLAALVEFYPRHIEKEDKVFFPAAMSYLSPEEQRRMLEEFDKFDKSMIHRKYKDIVKEIGG
jgi:hemerythrin-like domain-containing protein